LNTPQTAYPRRETQKTKQAIKKELLLLLNDLNAFLENNNPKKTGTIFIRIFKKLENTKLLYQNEESEILLSIITICCNNQDKIPEKIWTQVEIKTVINLQQTPELLRKNEKLLLDKFKKSNKIAFAIANFI
jgi:hypothetical protein